MTGSVRRAVAGSKAAFLTPCLDTFPGSVVASVVCTQASEPGPKRTIGRQVVGRGGETPSSNQPDRRSPRPRGGEQSQAYHFRPCRAVEIHACYRSPYLENVWRSPVAHLLGQKGRNLGMKQA